MPIDFPLSTDTEHVAIAPVSDESIRALLERRAREEPDAVYCYFKEDALTLSQLDRRVNQLANLLWDRGLRPGQRVALMLPSHPDHVVAIFALAKLGLVRVPVNVHLKGAALTHIFDHLDPHALIANTAYGESLKGELSKVEDVVWRGGGGANAFETYEQKSHYAPAVAVRPDDILALTPSSGTTGAPKGVLKSDRTLSVSIYRCQRQYHRARPTRRLLARSAG
jgi:crotonobetaine/carnitine-CoA ligase